MPSPRGHASPRTSDLHQGKKYAEKGDSPAISALTAIIDRIGLRETSAEPNDFETAAKAYCERSLAYCKAYHDRGIAYFDNRQYDKASQDFSKVIKMRKNVEQFFELSPSFNKTKVRFINELTPFEIGAYVFRGQISMRQGKTDLAIEAFTQAIRLAPTHFEAHYRRGLAYREMEESDKAADDFQRAYEIDPQSFRSVEPHYVGLRSRNAHPTTPDTRLIMTLLQ